jgi:molybdopterin converting factor small subunit
VIQVQAKLYATLRQYRPEVKLGEPIVLSVPDGTTVGELLQKLGVPREAVKTVFVNGLTRGEDHVLTDGDQIGAFPPVAGG